MKVFIGALMLLFIGFNSFSQNVYEWYQDGKVVLQLKTDGPVKLKSIEKEVDLESVPFIKSIRSEYGIQYLKHLHPDIKDEKLRNTFEIGFSNASKVESLINEIAQLSFIEYAEKKELHVTTLTPNDQYFVNATNNGQWALFQINAQQAWDVSTGNSSINIAITDNAFSVNHPDLVNKVSATWDAVDGNTDASGCGSNTGFHGSHVAGISGAQTNNNTGIASIGFDASLMLVKIGNCNGALTAGYDGIIWAADNGADVINMSWGGGGQSQYGQNTCTYAWNQGSILIAAAGNNNASTQFFPAAYNDVVAVASTTTNDSKSGFSQYGNWIDISAPGSSILSCNEGTGYQVTQGTSMASPLVAGLVGLMKSHAPNTSQQDIVDCLLNTADNIDAANPSYIGQLGSGRINAHQAMLCMNQYTFSLDAGINEIISPNGQICSGTITPEVVLKNFGSDPLTNVTINYQIDANPVQTFNWTGNLTQGATTNITLPTQNLGGGTFTFSAYTSNPNSGVDQNPSNNNQSVSFTTITNGEEVDFTLITDCYGSEINWEIVENSTGNIVSTGGNYSNVNGGETITETLCLSTGCYTFNITDDYGDGLYGSQWNCNVDGDYYMVDNNGNTLFELTAPNSDFGNGTSHNFCISSNLALDAGIGAINSPSGNLCSSNTISPQVVINNYGTQTLTSVDVLYQVSGGAQQTFNWTGSLGSGSNTTVTLPNLNVTTGSYSFSAQTSNPNGSTDQNTGNDAASQGFTIYNSSVALPFIEDFETNGFINNNWNINNPDNGITWEIETIGGTTPGNQAAKIDFFNYGAGGARDGMRTPPLNFSGYSGVQMTYDHAFRRYNTNSADSLIIYASTDCGNTYDRIVAYAEDGTGSFATQTTNTNDFTPAVADDWCTGPVGANCFTVDLSAYDGQSNVIIMFESFNNGISGNNLFIDNININGTTVGTAPNAGFTSNTNEVCEGSTINFTDQSTDGPTSWNWTFNGGTPATSSSQNPSVTYNTPGTYDVTLEVSNSNGSDVTTINTMITVNASPTINTNTVSAACEGATFNLTANGANTYTWTPTNTLNTSSGANVVASPTTTTLYTVSGTDANGCVGQSQINVEVLDAPNLVVTSNNGNEVCDGESVNLTASGANTYSWTGGGLSSSTGNSVTASPSITTTYSIVGTGANGCQSNETFELTVNPLPSVGISPSDTETCPSGTVTLTGTGASNYVWTPGATLDNTTGTIVTATPGVTTQYTVTGTDANGCENTSSITITVDPNAEPNITVSASEVDVCEGETVTLSATGADTYSWTGDGLVQTNGSPVTAAPISTTTYSVAGTNNCGTGNGFITINVIPLPATPIITQSGNTLSVNVTPGNSVQWYVNGIIINGATNPTHQMTVSGTYSVIVSNQEGCEVESADYDFSFNSDNVSLVENKALHIDVYPNPSKTDFYVAVNGGQTYDFNVMNSLGQVVFKKQSNNDFVINAKEWRNGVYFIQINTEENVITKRIVKVD